MNRVLYTIGFTKTNAQNFFERLKAVGISKLLDTRLNASSQLSGFAKSDDLAYFVPNLLSAIYVQAPSLAPTSDMLKSYRAKKLSWIEYEVQYASLLRSRDLSKDPALLGLDGACLLCSEHSAKMCHRRLAAEYLSTLTPGGLEIVHL